MGKHSPHDWQDEPAISIVQHGPARVCGVEMTFMTRVVTGWRSQQWVRMSSETVHLIANEFALRLSAPRIELDAVLPSPLL